MNQRILDKMKTEGLMKNVHHNNDNRFNLMSGSKKKSSSLTPIKSNFSVERRFSKYPSKEPDHKVRKLGSRISSHSLTETNSMQFNSAKGSVEVLDEVSSNK